MTKNASNNSSSTPSISEFNPDVISYQREVIRYVKKEYDYSKGILEVLLSGSVGSAKSVLAAHIGCLHLLMFKGAHLLLGRRTLPDLKDTIFTTICEHLEGTNGLEDGKHYFIKENTAKIIFCNGSRITSRAWGDKKFKKFRSLQLSAAIIEELTENDQNDMQAYVEISMRVGRLPHVPHSWILSCTNPDGPEHWAYDYFIKSKHPRRRVFYSRTDQNPFLPKSYIDGLKENLDPKMAQRMIYGRWVTISGETIYHQYNSERNFIEADYKVDIELPIWLSFDFNIALGKPLSSVLLQFDDRGAVHIFAEMVIEGLRTLENCDQLAKKGLLDYPVKYYITGDAAGRHKDTRNNRSDYDIIKSFMANYQQKRGGFIDYEMKVPIANPPIKKRHNTVNAYCFNAKGDTRLFCYKSAKVADKGLRLTKLKKGSNYVEDDSYEYQHITTAIGYALVRYDRMKNEPKQRMIQL